MNAGNTRSRVGFRSACLCLGRSCMQLNRFRPGSCRAGMFSRSMQLSVVAACLLTCLLPSVLAAPDDPLAPFRATTVTETEKRDQNGAVSGREIIRKTRIDLREQTQETYAATASGQVKLVARITTAQNNSTGKSVTTVESMINPQVDDLVVTSITTTIRDDSGGQVTTTETRDQAGTMITSNRTTVKQENGERTTTIESLNTEGKLVVTQKNTVQYPPSLVNLLLPQ